VTSRIRVLVVDDSAFARKVVRECLASDPGIDVVDTARDGLEALEKIAAFRPDVVTLDLVMPHLDGLGVLAGLRGDPLPRVVVVSTAEEDSLNVVNALSMGAITSVHKPTALATERLYEIAEPLVRAVRLAAQARAQPMATAPVAPVSALPQKVATKVLVIGASTGGPQAVTRILQALPADFPVPVALVVHMPVGYTEGFAARLDDRSALEVIEASEGAELRPGRVVVARAGVHLKIAAGGGKVALDEMPAASLHRPSVDALFASAAESYGQSTLGVVLTGMGDDGLLGCRAIFAKGGRIITEAAVSCVVYGMPRAVAEAGLSALSVPLDEMPRAIAAML
jgi:two-component system chemotaxis response regulator CheB